MTPLFEIRPVSSSQTDLEALLTVYRQCEDFLALGPVAHASSEMVLADLELSRINGGIFNTIFVAGKGVVGVVDLIPANFEGIPDQAYLELLMIALPARNQGLGAGVVAAIETSLRAAGIRWLLADVQTNNPSAQAFWLRRGFSVISPPRLQPDTTISVRLKKAL